MNVPRPLLVVVIVLIVLGIASCALGVVRGRMDAGQPAATPAALTGGLIDTPVRPPDVSVAGAAGGSCTIAGGTITVSTGCVATVDPQALRPRTLRLSVTSGTVIAVVRQTIRGEERTSDPDFFGVGDVIEASVAGTSPVDVALACASCSLAIID